MQKKVIRSSHIFRDYMKKGNEEKSNEGGKKEKINPKCDAYIKSSK